MAPRLKRIGASPVLGDFRSVSFCPGSSVVFSGVVVGLTAAYAMPESILTVIMNTIVVINANFLMLLPPCLLRCFLSLFPVHYSVST